MGEAVWDASALLVVLQREPGWQDLAGEIAGAHLGAVNLAEVASKLVDGGLEAPAAADLLRRLNLRIHPCDEGLALEIARLRPATRELGLSLGDRACLALGVRLGLPVLTADRSWAGLKLPVPVCLARS